ncbi:MAG: winged helix-turn-helix domain-containing protein [Clostridiales bacterium]|nr:winged helix-turn-helix domain-containing protein [Clostridiales bacterium]
MTKSSIIQENVLKFLSDRQKHSVQDIKSYLHDNEVNEYTEGQFAGSLNTLMKNDLIKKVDRGIYSIKLRSENMRKCFVISPIGEKGSEVRKRADQVFKYIIEPVCAETEFEPIRVDKLNQADSITQTIIDAIINSELVIADITGHNPNAFYEMGYRTSTGKPIIYLKEKNERIPFDIAGIRVFDYDLRDLDSVEEIKSRLVKTISALPFEESTGQNENGEVAYKGTNSDVSQLIQILYEIQDEISQLKNEIHDKDTETIQAIVKASMPIAPVEDPNTAIMKAILPELLKNPNSMKAFIEFSETANKNKK